MRQPGISQWATDTIGISVFDDDVLTDADSDVLVTVIRDSDSSSVVPSTPATHDGTGLYSLKFGTAVTATPDSYTANWNYTLDGDAKEFEAHFVVIDGSQPYWDALSAELRQVVEDVMFLISDTFDSSSGKGGPYLWEQPQSNFGFETVARLMTTKALDYINYSKPVPFLPPFNLLPAGVDGAVPFPTQWYGLLRQATYYQVLRHLCRSYGEQPEVVGVNTARFDRRAYSQFWCSQAEEEKVDLDDFLRMLKRKYIFKGRALLLAGGIFPASYLDPARPRWPYLAARF